MLRHALLLLLTGIYLAVVPSLGANAKKSFQKAEKFYEEAYDHGAVALMGPAVGSLSHAAHHLQQAVNAPGGEGWTKAWILKATVEAKLLERASDEQFVEMQTSRDAMARRYEDSILTATDLLRRHGAGTLENEQISKLSYQFRNVLGQSGYHFGASDFARGARLFRAALLIKELSQAVDDFWSGSNDDALRQLSVPLMGQVYQTDDDLFETALVAWLKAQPPADEIIALYQGLEKSVDNLAAARLLDLGRSHHPRNFGWLRLEVFVATRNGARPEHAPLIQSALDANDDWLSDDDPFLLNALLTAYGNGYSEAHEKGDAAELRRLFPLMIERVPRLREADKKNAQLLAWTCHLFLRHMAFLEREAQRFATLDAPDAAAQRDAVLEEMAEISRSGLAYFEEIEPKQYADPMVLTFLIHGYQSSGDTNRAAAFLERLNTLQSGGTLPGPYTAPPATPTP